MFIYELTKENKIRYWNTEIFTNVPNHREKVLFRVHDIEDHSTNPINEIYFPAGNDMDWIATREPDFFDLENSIMIVDETKEIKALKIENIWKFIQEGNWEKYEELKRVMNP